LAGCLKLLRNGNAACFLDAAKRRRAVAIITGDNDRDNLAGPILGEGTQENRDDVWPSPWF
jgi:hypothetical protein